MEEEAFQTPMSNGFRLQDIHINRGSNSLGSYFGRQIDIQITPRINNHQSHKSSVLGHAIDNGRAHGHHPWGSFTVMGVVVRSNYRSL